MPARIRLEMLGDKELDRAMRDLPLKVQRKYARKAAREAMRPVLQAAKAKAPVRTGRLRKGIRLRALKARRRGAVIGAVVITDTRQKMGIPPEDKGYYPAHVELGTSKMAAHPYLRPALHENRTKVVRKMGSVLWDQIRGGMKA